MRSLFLVAAGALLFTACSNENPSAEKEITKNDSAAVQTDTGTVFVFPAPLQVATWMRQNAGQPDMSLLAEHTLTAASPSTDYSRSLNLGILLADIGYTALYNQRQATLDRLALAEQLLQQLHLDNIAAPLIPRLKSNIENPDSLSRLVLILYDSAHKNLNQGGREKTAFYITSGIYLEGLTLTLSNKTIRAKAGFPQLLGQQKLWLGNLQEAITYLPQDPESQDLYNTFYTLQHYFEPMTVTMKGKLPQCAFTEEQLDALAKKAFQLRDEVVKGTPVPV